jgi:hypothetical protein
MSGMSVPRIITCSTKHGEDAAVKKDGEETACK